MVHLTETTMDFIKYKQLFICLYNEINPKPKVKLKAYLAVINKIETQYHSQKDKACIRLIKSLRLSIYHSLAGSRHEISFLKTDKFTLLPRLFGSEIGQLIYKKDRETVRLLLTVLQLSYLMTTKLDPDTTSIDLPSSADPKLLQNLKEWIKRHATSVIASEVDFTGWSEPHLTSSSGPLGPALWTALEELEFIPEGISNDLEILGGNSFKEWFRESKETKSMQMDLKAAILSSTQDLPSEGKKKGKQQGAQVKPTLKRSSLRRLAAIPAPEAKTRVIAILDYWSQTVLKPLHDWSFDLLKRMPNDLTFNQGGVISVLSSKRQLNSFDLSSATDRFPIDLQETFLSVMIGPERAAAWRRILVGQKFTTAWDNSEHVYGVGQPMGAYSSWSTFALTHHLVVHYAASLAGFPAGRFGDYALLGDDIVIAHPKVAENYRAVILGLGVGISPTKTLVSEDTFEFAKRIFHKDLEYTAFPLAACFENAENIAALWSTTLVARERGFTWLTAYAVPGVVAKMQSALGLQKRNSEFLARSLELLYTIADCSDPTDHHWAFQGLMKQIGFPIPCSGLTQDLKSRAEHFIKRSVIKYKERLLRSSISRFNLISNKALEIGLEGVISLLPPDFDEEDSQSQLPIEPSRLLFTWVLKINIEQQEKSISDLKSIGMRGSLKFYLKTLASRVASDLNRIISRRVNLKVLTESGRFVKFLRTEQNCLEQQYKSAVETD
jgi:hypothetical protein